MMIHEMKQVVWVTNETLGDGIIMAILDYGAHHNSVLMVGFESGDIKFLDTNQVKLTRNDTLGIGTVSWPIKFDFSEFAPDWGMAKAADRTAGTASATQEQPDDLHGTKPLIDPQLVVAQRKVIEEWNKRLHSLEVKSTLLDDILKRLTKLEKKPK